MEFSIEITIVDPLKKLDFITRLFLFLDFYPGRFPCKWVIMLPNSNNYVFMSYSRRDKDVMWRTTTFLRKQGINVWVDNEKLTPGTPIWEHAIEKAVESATAVVVVMSPDSKNSEWVRREISLADQYQKRVFPILVRGDEDSAITIRLITRQFVDLRTNESEGLNSLCTALSQYIGEFESQEFQGRVESQKPIRDTKPIIQNPTVHASEFDSSKEVISKSEFFVSWLGRLLIGAIVGLVATFIMSIVPKGYFGTSFSIAILIMTICGIAGLVMVPNKSSFIIVIVGFLASGIFFSLLDPKSSDLNYFIGTGVFFGVPLGALTSRVLHWFKIIK